MSFGDNNGNGPRPIGDPTISGRFDGRTPNEQRFTDFPNNPDLYGHIDPLATQNDRNAPPHRKRDPPLGNFAPPGQFPAGFAPNNPNRGIDGQGGLIVTDPLMIGGGGPGRGGRNGGQPQIRGDLDMMVANGVVPPGPRLQGQYGGLGGFDEMDEMGLPPPGRGGRGGFGDLPGMGGPRGGFGGMPGMGGLGGPRGGFGGGFGF